ncbi:MAG: hypothetical protein ACK5MD_00290 [Flavobacteriales bacterium]
MQYILNSNKESVLAKFKSIIEKEKEQEIVGYTVQGKPLTVADMNEKLTRSEEDYKAGRVTTHEELLKEMKTW